MIYKLHLYMEKQGYLRFYGKTNIKDKCVYITFSASFNDKSNIVETRIIEDGTIEVSDGIDWCNFNTDLLKDN